VVHHVHEVHIANGFNLFYIVHLTATGVEPMSLTSRAHQIARVAMNKADPHHRRSDAFRDAVYDAVYDLALRHLSEVYDGRKSP
jgi:hypothetical protein